MPRKTPDAADVMLNAIAEYLKSKGWKVLVIGDAKVQQHPDAERFNFEFVVRFTGGPPKDLTPPPAAG